MENLPDIVRDSKLEVKFSQGHTIHVHYETDPSTGRRAVPRTEAWRPRRQIGRGAFGDVWSEECAATENDADAVRLRAVKKISTIQHRIKPSMFQRELKAISKFSHNKYERCFVKSFGWFEESEAICIAMEYLELGDLHHYLIDNSPLPEDDAGHITAQIVEGLSFMHENGFSHRDLKPQNILVKSRPPDPWWIKIGDFGVSKRAEDQIGSSTTLKGTLGYIAPELHGFTARSTDPATDIWAVGEISYQMLTGSPSFKSLGLLLKYVHDPALFPTDQLRIRSVSQLAAEFLKSAMNPLATARITAHTALVHPWIKRFMSIPSPVLPTFAIVPSSDLKVDFSSEELGQWTTVKTEPPALHDSNQTFQKLVTGRRERFHVFDFSPDGRFIAGAASSKIYCWEIPPARSADTIIRPCLPVATLAFQWAVIKKLKWSPVDQERIAIVKEERLHIICSLESIGPEIVSGVSSMAYSRDGRNIACGTKSGEVFIIDVSTQQRTHCLSYGAALELDQLMIELVVYSPNQEILAFGTKYGITIWDTKAEHATPITLFNSHLDYGFLYASYSPDIASFSPDIACFSPDIASFSPDGTMIITAAQPSGIVRTWDVKSGNIIHEYADLSPLPVSGAFSADIKSIAYCSYDLDGIAIVDIKTGQRIQMLHTSGATKHGILEGIVFSAKQNRIAASSSTFFGPPADFGDEHDFIGVWTLPSTA